MTQIKPTSIGELILTFKTHLYAKKYKWQTFEVKDAVSFVSKIIKSKLENGESGIWLKPILTDISDAKYYWIILDVESQDHDNVQANLDVGKDFLCWLGEKKMTDGLKIMLSGRALRFIWPYIVPPMYNKAFRLWISDRDNFPIDNSPQGNSFFRFFAYRGNRAQDSNPQNMHTHLLSDFNDLWFLMKKDYLEMVSGRVSAETYLGWLAADLLPRKFTPEPWIELFEAYDRRLKLRGSIFQQQYIRRSLSRNHEQIMVQIDEYLKAVGKEMHENQTGDIIFWRIKGGCPSCGRTDGNPFVTPTGRLKCYHANSCPAGVRAEDGKIMGLSPSQWVEGFQYIDLLDLDEDSQIKKTSVENARSIISEALESDSDILLKATPGSGKTITTLKELICTVKNCEDTIHCAN